MAWKQTGQLGLADALATHHKALEEPDDLHELIDWKRIEHLLRHVHGSLYFRGATCLIRLNSFGEFLPSSNDEIYKLDKVNVLYLTNIAETELLDNRKISWQKKLDMQHGKAKNDKTINRKLFSQEGK